MNGAATPPPDWATVLDRAHRMVTQRLATMAAIGALGAVLLLAGGLIGRAAVADDDPATGGSGDTPAKQESGAGDSGTNGESQGGTEGSGSEGGGEEPGDESRETEETEPELPAETESPETEEPEIPEPEVAEPPAEEAAPPPEEEFRAPR